MVALRKIVVWFQILAGSAVASNQATKNSYPLAQALSSLQTVEFRELGAAWTDGAVEAFKKHGTALKDSVEATYAQMPSEIRDQVEKAHGHLMDAISSPEVMEFQKLAAEWTAGVMDAFKKHGTALKETAEATYAQLPSEFRHEVDKAHAQVYEVEWNNLSVDIQDWIQEHPYQTAFYVVNGIVFFAPATSSGPILWALGFAGKGPRAASFASMLQSKFGLFGAKSIYAHAQSAAMGGYGVTAVNMVTRLGVAASSLLGGMLGLDNAGRNGTAKL